MLFHAATLIELSSFLIELGIRTGVRASFVRAGGGILTWLPIKY